jgi:hypothetical protein
MSAGVGLGQEPAGVVTGYLASRNVCRRCDAYTGRQMFIQDSRAVLLQLLSKDKEQYESRYEYLTERMYYTQQAAGSSLDACIHYVYRLCKGSSLLSYTKAMTNGQLKAANKEIRVWAIGNVWH